MAKFRGAVLNCAQCGKEFRVPPVRAATAKSCSNACAYIQRGKSNQKRVALTCATCGKIYEMPECHAARRKHCSQACQERSPETIALKAGRTGAKNGYWKGGRRVRADRYIYAVARKHPYAAPNGYVLEHRLVMEEWLRENEPESPFLIEIDAQKYLSREFEVHHKDLTRTNNDISNLQCMTFKDHRALHTQITKAALEYYRINVINKGK